MRHDEHGEQSRAGPQGAAAVVACRHGHAQCPDARAEAGRPVLALPSPVDTASVHDAPPQPRGEPLPAAALPAGSPLARVLALLLWLPTRLLWLLVRVYQTFISPALPAACRYYPSCSQYAAEALLTHGAFKGTWLAARRLLRCHPWAIGGPDPVPPRPAPAPRTVSPGAGATSRSS